MILRDSQRPLCHNISSSCISKCRLAFISVSKDLVEARGGIDKNEQQAMRDIRNAFGHNHYAETDIKDLPKIAVEMVDKFGKLIDKNKAK
ncbi:MAG: hypothetical protein J6C05_12160 [Prevotella sp.]|nr:hypothetical protein [Prevotella sp.]